MTIKTIIFDLGVVLLDISSERMKKAFIDLGATPAKIDSERYKELVSGYGMGKIGTATFRKDLAHELDIDEAEFDKAWNSEIIRIPAEKLALLEELRKAGYMLILFSNTNALHYEEILRVCERDHHIEGGLRDYFDRQYFSHVMKMAKPNPDAFSRILRDNDLEAKETLFIDDLLPNVEGARKVDLHTIHFTAGMTVPELRESIEKEVIKSKEVQIKDDQIKEPENCFSLT